jgi:TonB family protein
MVSTNTSKRIGIIGTLGFHTAFVLMLLLIGLKPQQPLPAEESILINFGDSDVGSGSVEPSAADNISQAAPNQQEVQEESPMTQDLEDAPSLPTKKIIKKKVTVNLPSAKIEPQISQATPTTPAEKPREVNKRALFPGRSNSGLPSQGEGDGGGIGNQGNPNGSPDSKSRIGGSTGNGKGHSFSLNGRHIVGGFPNPAYNVQASGKVIVAITVNQSGNVTKATYSPKGSTTSDSRLISAAIAAAQHARFNIDQDAPSIQTGNITYIFNLQ